MPARPAHSPPPGTRIVRHCGDTMTFSIVLEDPADGEAWLRTNIGYAATHRAEIIRQVEEGAAILRRDWHDVPMRRVDERKFAVTLPLLEVGRFEAKGFFLPDAGGQNEAPEPVWPAGDNVVIKVEPAAFCSASSIYCVFVRQFGANQVAGAEREQDAAAVAQLEAAGYEVIPRSGKFRDVVAKLDHIVYDLGFRILQLLPIFPTPTTYARMGRFGSPFAALDFTGVDPALAEFDRRTTPMDQFCELVDETHRRDALIFLDVPINHTGWASWLQMHHPEWFHRHEEDESFVSPGAWGVTWADLSKLDYRDKALWTYMADVFLFWCRRGVDGFRCDAGYMVPIPVWEYITAKVRREFPDTAFLLEGLGGDKGSVFRMLDQANLNWAYSELFQNDSLPAVEAILAESIEVSCSHGNQVHFAETHDNNRLAARSHAWSRMRTALSALCSCDGGFGITCGVEWFAEEKVDVHRARGLNWGAQVNQVGSIRRLNAVLAIHPAFHHGAGMTMRYRRGSDPVLVLLRNSAERLHPVLVIVNLDAEHAAVAQWDTAGFAAADMWDLLSGEMFQPAGGEVALAPGQCRCFSLEPAWLPRIAAFLKAGGGEARRSVVQRLRAKALEIRQLLVPGQFPEFLDADAEAASLSRDPGGYCAAVTGAGMPRCVRWQWPADARRVVLLPPGFVLLLESGDSFIAELRCSDGAAAGTILHERSLPAGEDPHAGQFAVFVPPGAAPRRPRMWELTVTAFLADGRERRQAQVLMLPRELPRVTLAATMADVVDRHLYALCANGRGALAHVQGVWGEIRSQYDALLAANPHPDFPVDRRILFTRCRAWIVHRDYSTALDKDCQTGFMQLAAGAARWTFSVPTGMGKHIDVDCTLRLAPGRNAVALEFHRHGSAAGDADTLDDSQSVRLILRPDIEDREFHHKTKAHAGAEHAWPGMVTPHDNGFDFAPGHCVLQMRARAGSFTSEPEWHYMVAHSIDAERGLDGASDLFSPGYFTMELRGGGGALLSAHLAGEDVAWQPRKPSRQPHEPAPLALEDAARRAIGDFIVKRDASRTVIAGYPWFLDWGRDTLICLRGIVAAGMLDEARDILRQFARYEKRGTLPNMIRGGDDSNRDTSDAQLWFFTACADLCRAEGSDAFLGSDCGNGRTIVEVLESLAQGYVDGTSNGIRVDPESGLVFSPSHFTWMDTNFPAGTPREGYPIEIQALWHAALTFLAGCGRAGPWREFAARVGDSIFDHFWDDGRGFLSDCLHAAPGVPAAAAVADDHLRSNQLFAVTLGAVTDARICRAVIASSESLLVPGGIRSLADRPVRHELPVRHHGHLLNHPAAPYWGRYEGDEDTRRKPAYHNGTAWTWPFPSFAEALVLVHGDDARATARAILASSALLFDAGCLGHLPEILDGDAPHRQRGCGAQAWAVTELYRVLRLLGDLQTCTDAPTAPLPKGT